jgi:hypothetical protein
MDFVWFMSFKRLGTCVNTWDGVNRVRVGYEWYWKQNEKQLNENKKGYDPRSLLVQTCSAIGSMCNAQQPQTAPFIYPSLVTSTSRAINNSDNLI